MVQKDQSGATLTLIDWLRMGKAFFSVEDLEAFLTIIEARLREAHSTVFNKVAQLQTERSNLRMDDDADVDAETEQQASERMRLAVSMLHGASSPGTIPAPDEALSVPKVILHFVKHRRDGAKASELLAFVRKYRPGKARTSVYSALHQLCSGKRPQMRKEGSGRDFTYFLTQQKGGR